MGAIKMITRDDEDNGPALLRYGECCRRNIDAAMARIRPELEARRELERIAGSIANGPIRNLFGPDGRPVIQDVMNQIVRICELRKRHG